MSPITDLAAAIWSRLVIEKPRDDPDVDRLVRQVQFWRTAVAGLLIGLIAGGAVIKAWAPEPGQRYQIRITWEAIGAEPAAAPAHTTQERRLLAKEARP